MGLRPGTGTVYLDAQDITRASPRDRLRAGVAYIPEDRQEDGIVKDFSVADNLVLDTYDRPPHARGIAMDLAAIRQDAKRLADEFDIRTSSIDTPVGTLSGGNQQKVILAREVGRRVRLLLASQPTRGLDVGSIEFVHRRIVEERDQGVAVIIVSSELDEIYALADRIAVMYEGKITGFRPPTVPVAELGLLMAGAGGGPGDAPEEAAGDGLEFAAPAAVTEAGNPALGVLPLMSTDPVVTTHPAGRGADASDGPAAGASDGPAGGDGPPGSDGPAGGDAPPGSDGPDGQAEPA
jgi:simple sugar transport system ATP-binding protein